MPGWLYAELATGLSVATGWESRSPSEVKGDDQAINPARGGEVPPSRARRSRCPSPRSPLIRRKASSGDAAARTKASDTGFYEKSLTDDGARDRNPLPPHNRHAREGGHPRNHPLALAIRGIGVGRNLWFALAFATSNSRSPGVVYSRRFPARPAGMTSNRDPSSSLRRSSGRRRARGATVLPRLPTDSTKCVRGLKSRATTPPWPPKSKSAV